MTNVKFEIGLVSIALSFVYRYVLLLKQVATLYK